MNVLHLYEVHPGLKPGRCHRRTATSNQLNILCWNFSISLILTEGGWCCGQYATWCAGGDKDSFYTTSYCQQLYQNHIKTMVNR